MPRVSLTLILPFALWGCADSGLSEPSEIRVHNVASIVMEDVVIAFPGAYDPTGLVEPGDAEFGEVSYGTIPPESVTPYRTILKAYPIAPVRVIIEGEELMIQPDDYVGEVPLGSGQFTYELDFTEGTLHLRLAHDSTS